MKVTFLLTLIVALFLWSCDGTSERNISGKEKIVIELQPLGDIPSEHVNFVYEECKKFNSNIVLKKPIPLPKSAFNLSKTRYRADSLIRILRDRTADGHVCLGLTSLDISTTNDKIADWGVMGLGYCPGKSCIASSYRLKKGKKKEQLFKVAIHELGHTQGLQHCEEKSCFMRDAEGKNHTDEEVEFCKKCKKKLIRLGWVFEEELEK